MHGPNEADDPAMDQELHPGEIIYRHGETIPLTVMEVRSLDYEVQDPDGKRFRIWFGEIIERAHLVHDIEYAVTVSFPCGTCQYRLSIQTPHLDEERIIQHCPYCGQSYLIVNGISDLDVDVSLLETL